MVMKELVKLMLEILNVMSEISSMMSEILNMMRESKNKLREQSMLEEVNMVKKEYVNTSSKKDEMIK
jgi:hypothetical protein